MHQKGAVRVFAKHQITLDEEEEELCFTVALNDLQIVHLRPEYVLPNILCAINQDNLNQISLQTLILYRQSKE